MVQSRSGAGRKEGPRSQPRFPVPPAEASAHPPSALGIGLFRTFHTMGPCVLFATDGFRLTASSRLTDQGGCTFALRSARDGQPDCPPRVRRRGPGRVCGAQGPQEPLWLGGSLPALGPAVLCVIVALSGERLRSRLF